ncbi:MAG: aminoacyl-tRNA hydrolase [bacterium]|nr:aminoacyl-tRNA hydrolase [bacterium]
MKLIVGLGNPGEKYSQTRHNLGFMVLDKLLPQLTSAEETTWQRDTKTKSEIFKLGDLILVKPQTYMNNCGFTIKKLADFYHISPENIWVIHDDLDLPLGRIKIRKGGGTAGHHGLDSIAEKLGSFDFVRFRLGIDKVEGHDELSKDRVGRREVENYILGELSPKEHNEVKKVIKRVIEAIELASKKSLDQAMNQFNLK